MTEPTEERPLVTFALLAYNQEKYIREAIEGAFSQTYAPLEIILSDDCSSDQTFQIIQQMAAKYNGRHRVITRQSKMNRGIIGHVNDLAALAKGEIIVLAAGDDVSYPKRCDLIVSAFRSVPDLMARILLKLPLPLLAFLVDIRARLIFMLNAK